MLNWGAKNTLHLTHNEEQACCFMVHHSLLYSLVLFIVQIDINVTLLFTWCFCISYWILKKQKLKPGVLKEHRKEEIWTPEGIEDFYLMPSDEVVVSARRRVELCYKSKIAPLPPPRPLLKGNWAECVKTFLQLMSSNLVQSK